MPFLEVQLTAKLHRLYEVQPDTLIGRAPQCQVQLLSRAVSRRHARIEFDGETAVISDLGTKNGIKLNGARVEGAALVQDGDRVLVGDITMRYRADDRSVAEEDVIDLRGRVPGLAEVEAACAPRATFLLQAHPTAVQQFGSMVGRGRIAQLALEEEVKLRLQIALKEALDNALQHGSRGDPERNLWVTFSEDDDEFVMSVKDEGQGYDFERALHDNPEIDALEAVRRRHELGKPLGLRIVLNCVDRLQFSGSGNTIHMGRFKAGGQLFVISDDGLD